MKGLFKSSSWRVWRSIKEPSSWSANQKPQESSSWNVWWHAKESSSWRVLVQDLSLSNERRHPELDSGSTSCAVCHAGFTLIELLVVVLIIGILAAIAVPQYQKAVLKARASEALVQGKALLAAEQAYVLSNGAMTMDLDALDVTLPENLRWECWAGYCQYRRLSSYGLVYEINNYFGTSHLSLCCIAFSGNRQAQQICASQGALHHTHNNNGYYLILK